MPFTYDVSTDRGKLRLLITDTDSDHPIFQDAEIDTFFAMETSSVRLGAALALETIASNEALTLKVIERMDLKTDGAKTSDALLKRAAELRKQAEAAGEGTIETFDIAEMVTNDFQWREKIYNEALRESG